MTLLPVVGSMTISVVTPNSVVADTLRLIGDFVREPNLDPAELWYVPESDDAALLTPT